MCGRYTLTKLEQVLKDFPGVQAPVRWEPGGNIAPTQGVLVLANNHPDRFEVFRWGLVPSWAKDPSIGSRMINARAETLAQKPAFKTALRRRRCLVPADGFYEWRKDPAGRKTPMHLRLKNGKTFAFAGLWDVWHAPDGSSLPTLTLITTPPNALVSPIHNRMPAILPPEQYARWLDPAELEPEAVLPLLKPYPADQMQAVEVPRLPNCGDPPDGADHSLRPDRLASRPDRPHRAAQLNLWGEQEDR